jgi:hypothetical protein
MWIRAHNFQPGCKANTTKHIGYVHFRIICLVLSWYVFYRTIGTHIFTVKLLFANNKILTPKALCCWDVQKVDGYRTVLLEINRVSP